MMEANNIKTPQYLEWYLSWGQSKNVIWILFHNWTFKEWMMEANNIKTPQYLEWYLSWGQSKNVG